MDILIFILLAVTLFVWLYILLSFLFRSSLATRSRLDEIEQIDAQDELSIDTSALTGRKPGDENFNFPVLGPYLRSVATKLTQAHVMIKPVEFVVISLVTAMLVFLITNGLTQQVWPGIIAGIIGYLLPTFALSRSRNKRAKKLNDQLPEFMNVLSNALRAGLSFNQAIASASGEMEDPISWEFQKVMRDNNLGKPLDEALNDLVVRTGDEDIELFVNAVTIQRQTGGNLSEILDLIAKTIRERVRLKGEVNTLTAQSKMSALIISLLPIALAVIISLMNPGFMAPLFENPIGQIMLVIAAVMMIVGVFMLRKITSLEV